jgi:CspA family cold shock protein
MATGTVTWYDPHRGIGFITPDDGRKTVICLITPDRRIGLESLGKGRKVCFDYGRGKDGKLPCAQNIELLD